MWPDLSLGNLLIFAVLACIPVALLLLFGNRTGNISELVQKLQEMNMAYHRLEGTLRQINENDNDWRLRSSDAMDRRLDSVRQDLGEAMNSSAKNTAHVLGELKQRLEVIDQAQEKVVQLSGEVLSLQDILSNKQARGAFGELQLAEIMRMNFPTNAYQMQATLSNGRRADCLINLPKPPGSLAIDAKFPLESWRAFREHEQTPNGLAEKHLQEKGQRAFKTAMLKHIADISERYIVEGETADSALMFVPSEAIYADLHGYFPEIVRKGFEAKVWIVSPTTLMATLTTLRAVLQDTKMRENADSIRKEMRLLYGDIGRMQERTRNLNRHFAQAIEDVQDILLSAEKAGRRSMRLQNLEFEEAKNSEQTTGTNSTRQNRHQATG